MQQKQIAEEEKKLEEDKKKTMIEFREQLASQTADALKEQERQMGLIIARLQVGKRDCIQQICAGRIFCKVLQLAYSFPIMLTL